MSLSQKFAATGALLVAVAVVAVIASIDARPEEHHRAVTVSIAAFGAAVLAEAVAIWSAAP